MLANALLVVGIAALYNSIQCFVPRMAVTSRIYALAPNQVTPLMARMMGTWTLTSAMVRVYAAYHIAESGVYDLCIGTFLIAFCSFVGEVLVYKTAPWYSPGVWPALLVSTGFTAWMIIARDHYIA